MHISKVKQLIEEKLPGAVVEVSSPDGNHFEAVVTSQLFEGKTRVQQQQMVYSALNQQIATGEIHAISLKTYTSAEQ